jgi:hypothetical protein
VQPTGRAPRDSCAQELPFCGVIQGQYIVWERTVYVQTPIDKLPQVFWLHAASRRLALTLAAGLHRVLRVPTLQGQGQVRVVMQHHRYRRAFALNLAAAAGT